MYFGSYSTGGYKTNAAGMDVMNVIRKSTPVTVAIVLVEVT
jgi:hypothetical protein